MMQTDLNLTYNVLHYIEHVKMTSTKTGSTEYFCQPNTNLYFKEPIDHR